MEMLHGWVSIGRIGRRQSSSEQGRYLSTFLGRKVTSETPEEDELIMSQGRFIGKIFLGPSLKNPGGSRGVAVTIFQQ
jgi:hypothetical protein